MAHKHTKYFPTFLQSAYYISISDLRLTCNFTLILNIEFIINVTLSLFCFFT